MSQLSSKANCNFQSLNLDLINIVEHYDVPTQRLPFGLSVHNSIEVQQKSSLHMKYSSCTQYKSKESEPKKSNCNGLVPKDSERRRHD